MDLVLRNATLMGGGAEGPRDVGVLDGNIAEIAPKIAAHGREELDLAGRLLTPGLVESHIHLDKSRIVDRCAPEAGRNAANAVKRVQEAKRGFTVEDVYARAKATLELAILQGTTRMRTHVEVDPENERKTLGGDLRIVLFQAIRELLVNVVKHARASHVKISMKYVRNNLQIVVQDDGLGFEPSPGGHHETIKGFGLFNIRERLHHLGAQIKIESSPGKGTKATLNIPHEIQYEGGKREQDDDKNSTGG